MKISERADQIASTDEFELALHGGLYCVRERHLAQALDEWQESVEHRLAEVRHEAGFDRPPVAAPARMTPHEFVAEQLRKRDLTITPSSDPPFVISDPGPSKYDPEPEPEIE